MADKNAQVDPTGPFARRVAKHEWSESVPASVAEANAKIAGMDGTSGGAGGKEGSSGTAGGAAKAGNKKSAAGDANAHIGFGQEALATLNASLYTPIKRATVNGALVSLFGDKRLLLLGGTCSGESTTQVAEFDVAAKQWSHGVPMPTRRSEGTAAVVFVAPPAPSSDSPLPQLGGGASVSAAGASKAANAQKQSTEQLAAAQAASTPQQLVVLFGGFDDANVLSDTWFYLLPGSAPPAPEVKVQGKWWRLSSAAATPPARRGHAMATLIDSSQAAQSMPGGVSPGAAAAAAGATPGSAAAVALFQQLRFSTSVFVFGGFDGQKRLGDTWELQVPYACNSPASVTPATVVPADGLAWKKLAVTGFQPTPRDGASLAADPAHRRLLLFGGFTTHRENDCYALDTDTQVWTKLSVAPSPGPRFGTFFAVSGLFALLGLGQDAKGPSSGMFQMMLPSPGSDQHAQPRWSLCPVENAAAVEGGAKGKDKDAAAAAAEAADAALVEPRVDFSWTVTPELGPIFFMTHVPDKKGGGTDSARGAGSGEAQQRKTLWVFGGSDDKSYLTSLLEIELDRPEVQSKGARK